MKLHQVLMHALHKVPWYIAHVYSTPSTAAKPELLHTQKNQHSVYCVPGIRHVMVKVLWIQCAS